MDSQEAIQDVRHKAKLLVRQDDKENLDSSMLLDQQHQKKLRC
jgi:hypothetical protein